MLVTNNYNNADEAYKKASKFINIILILQNVK
jgi:hypothetical protein